MALTTIAIEGKGVIANCDALTNDTGGTGTGDWSEVGGGTMALSTDVFLVGSSCVGGKYAGKSGFQQFDLGSGNELDFTASTGTEDGQMIYMWVSMSALGTLDTLANYALCIRVSSSSPGTSNYCDYLIAGNDGANGWTGGFKCFIIDPTKTPSRVSGTQSSIIASVRTLGIWIDCSSSARADTIFIDQIAVGTGVRITGGSSTTGIKDVVDYCTAYASRGWGMWQEREGIYYTYGKTYIGDSTQTATLTFQDQGRIVQFGVSEYYESAAWKSSVPLDFSGIVVEDASSYATTFEDGVIVGTDGGRSGTVFIGNSQMDVTVDLYGGSEAGSLTKLYGTSFRALTGGITWGNDSDHLFYGGSVIGCGQFDPVGAVKLRNLIFVGTTDSYGGSNVDGAALLWNDNIDIEDCQFIANTDATGDPSGVQHDQAGTFDYTNLTFSGNDFDILHNRTANVEGSYGSGNQDGVVAVSGGWNLRQAQTFTVGISAVTLSRAIFYLQKIGSPTGNCYAKLYATTGVGTAPTGSPLATSNAVDVSTIGGSLGLIDFEFEDEYLMGVATTYGISFEYTGGDGSNYVNIGMDNSSPGHSGEAYYYVSSWTGPAGYDHVFYVHEGGIIKINNTGGNVSDDDNFQATNAGALIVVASVTLSIKVIDVDTDPIQDVQVGIFRSSDKAELMNEDTLATGFATESFNYPGSDVDIYIRARKSSPAATRYKPFSTTGLIESGGFSLTITLEEDPIA